MDCECFRTLNLPDIWAFRFGRLEDSFRELIEKQFVSGDFFSYQEIFLIEMCVIAWFLLEITWNCLSYVRENTATIQKPAYFCSIEPKDFIAESNFIFTHGNSRNVWISFSRGFSQFSTTSSQFSSVPYHFRDSIAPFPSVTPSPSPHFTHPKSQGRATSKESLSDGRKKSGCMMITWFILMTLKTRRQPIQSWRRGKIR